MSSEYSHYNSLYDKSFIEAQTGDHKYTRKEVNPPNPIYKHPIQYYDSPVKHSMLYPNLMHI